MLPIEIGVNEARNVNRDGYIIEQGIPVRKISTVEVGKLGVFDESGVQVPAGIETESVDPDDSVSWLTVSIPVSIPSGGEQKLVIKESDAVDVGETLDLKLENGSIFVSNRHFAADFTNPGRLTVKTEQGTVMDGGIDFSLQSDVRSKYGRLITVGYEPGKFEIVSSTPKRVHLLNRGRYTALEPKTVHISKNQRFDVDLEFIIYADSPVIRYRWRITNHMKFNCRYMWLSQYAIKFPLPNETTAVAGEESPEGDKFSGWAQVNTPGGTLGIAFPQWEWFGKGAGIEIKDGWATQGGINPPADGGFGNTSPDIWRMFYYGMSRTFEGALVVGGSEDQVKAEANPIPLILSPQYYADCGALPENGGPVTWGKWEAEAKRGGENLLRSQWKGTLWCGEWWREWDVITSQGTQETNSGNSGLGVLYHFYRTGDWRFWESAKMSYYYTFDIQFCKQEERDGPYMHTRRFLLDHQEWFHPRYQRIGTMIKVGHLLSDKVARDKVIWYLRWWGDNYVAEDGAPMTPNSNGTKSKCSESAMSNFAESLCYAYVETGDEWFLEKAKLLGDWVVRGFDADTDNSFVTNNNDTRYIQRGLIALCQVTNDPKYIDAFCRIAEWTVRQDHYVPNHLWFLSQAYKWRKSKEVLDGLMYMVNDMLEHESHVNPGAYLYAQTNSLPPYPDCVWDDFYAKKAIVSYLPLVASTIGREE